MRAGGGGMFWGKRAIWGPQRYATPANDGLTQYVGTKSNMQKYMIAHDRYPDILTTWEKQE